MNLEVVRLVEPFALQSATPSPDFRNYSVLSDAEPALVEAATEKRKNTSLASIGFALSAVDAPGGTLRLQLRGAVLREGRGTATLLPYRNGVPEVVDLADATLALRGTPGDAPVGADPGLPPGEEAGLTPAEFVHTREFPSWGLAHLHFLAVTTLVPGDGAGLAMLTLESIDCSLVVPESGTGDAPPTDCMENT